MRPDPQRLDRYLRQKMQGVWSERYFPKACAYLLDEPTRVKFLRDLAQSGALSKDSRILEVGSGLGTLVSVARRGSYVFYGIDINERDVQFARGLWPDLKAKSSPLLIGDGSALPFGDGVFDLVILFDVLEHTPTPLALLDEASRVVAPGGHLYVHAPNYAWRFVEPHYRLPWFPMLPKTLASKYLCWVGRDPDYLVTSVFNLTTRRVMRYFEGRKMPMTFMQARKVRNPSQIQRRVIRKAVAVAARLGLDWLLQAFIRSPFNPVISVLAKKPLPVGLDVPTVTVNPMGYRPPILRR